MSHTIKNFFAFTVLAVLATTFVAGSADAANIQAVAQRRQHPGVGFYVHSHNLHNNAVSVTPSVYRSAVQPIQRFQTSQPFMNQYPVQTPLASSAAAPLSQGVAMHHASLGRMSSVKPVTYQLWRSTH